MAVAEKQRLRRAFRARRGRLSKAQQDCHAALVRDAIEPRLAAQDTVAAYLARDGELDLAPLVDACWRRGIVIAVPVLGRRRMRFAAYRPGETMAANRFGIPEPATPCYVAPSVVLTPLVAFDDAGRRLGMGGGYYDRYFAAAPSLPRIGIAHECQRAVALPADRTDMPLNAVVTERGWQPFGGFADTC